MTMTNGGLTTQGPPQGRNTNIHPFVGPAKGVKKVRLRTSTKTIHHCLCWWCFSQKFFICWWNKLYYQQHLDVQARPSHWLPNITLLDITVIGLALQMRHELKETLHDYWCRLSYTLRFTARPWHMFNALCPWPNVWYDDIFVNCNWVATLWQ